MHKRTKACSISKEVREAVEERDNHQCIFCGSGDCRGEAHYIRRSQGGLGIPENLLCVCRSCHRQLDEGPTKEIFQEIAKQHLKEHYPYWDESKLVYSKWT